MSYSDSDISYSPSDYDSFIVGVFLLILLPGIIITDWMVIFLGFLLLLMSVFHIAVIREDYLTDGFLSDNFNLFYVFSFISAVLFIWSPLVQGQVYSLLYYYPTFVQILLLLLAHYVLKLIKDKYIADDRNILKNSVRVICYALIILSVISLAGFLLLSPYAKEDLSQEVYEKTGEMQSLDYTSSENISGFSEDYYWMKTSENNTISENYSLSKKDTLVSKDGVEMYSWSLNNQGMSKLRSHSKGIVYANMGDKDLDLEIKEREIKYNKDSILWKDLKWNVIEKDYWKEYAEVKTFTHEGSIYRAVPYIEHNYDFKFPTVYSTPTFGGVKIVSEDGDIEDLSPEEAINSEILKGKNIYPSRLARFEVASMKYSDGFFINDPKSSHLINTIPNSDVTQPFIMDTEEGYKYVITTKGDNIQQSVVKRIWFIDARTGEKERYTLEPVADSPESSYSIILHKYELDTEQIEVTDVEPLIFNNNLHWKFNIALDNSQRFSNLYLVNSRSNDVHEYGEEELPLKIPPSNDRKIYKTNSQNDSNVTVVIEQPNGEVKRINVTNGSKVIVR